ncbi:MAG: hypothetical protein HY722_16445 [Planctomycetes bacterium]|nr:hypothetical protein [Planctomycetota bacterium]
MASSKAREEVRIFTTERPARPRGREVYAPPTESVKPNRLASLAVGLAGLLAVWGCAAPPRPEEVLPRAALPPLEATLSDLLTHVLRPEGGLLRRLLAEAPALRGERVRVEACDYRAVAVRIALVGGGARVSLRLRDLVVSGLYRETTTFRLSARAVAADFAFGGEPGPGYRLSPWRVEGLEVLTNRTSLGDFAARRYIERSLSRALPERLGTFIEEEVARRRLPGPDLAAAWREAWVRAWGHPAALEGYPGSAMHRAAPFDPGLLVYRTRDGIEVEARVEGLALDVDLPGGTRGARVRVEAPPLATRSPVPAAEAPVWEDAHRAWAASVEPEDALPPEVLSRVRRDARVWLRARVADTFLEAMASLSTRSAQAAPVRGESEGPPGPAAGAGDAMGGDTR